MTTASAHDLLKQVKAKRKGSPTSSATDSQQLEEALRGDQTINDQTNFDKNNIVIRSDVEKSGTVTIDSP